MQVLHGVWRTPIAVIQTRAGGPLQTPCPVCDHVGSFKSERSFDLIYCIRHGSLSDVFKTLFLFVSVDSRDNRTETSFLKRHSSSLHLLAICCLKTFPCVTVTGGGRYRINIYSKSSETLRRDSGFLRVSVQPGRGIPISLSIQDHSPRSLRSASKYGGLWGARRYWWRWGSARNGI